MTKRKSNRVKSNNVTPMRGKHQVKSNNVTPMKGEQRTIVHRQEEKFTFRKVHKGLCQLQKFWNNMKIFYQVQQIEL